MYKKFRRVRYKIIVVTILFSLTFIPIQQVWSGEGSSAVLESAIRQGVGAGSSSADKTAEELAKSSSAGRAGIGVTTGLSSTGIAGIAAAVVALVGVVATAQTSTSTSSHHQ